MPAKKIICERCGEPFVCDPEGDCWCKKMSLGPEVIKQLRRNFSSCLCERCLEIISSEKQ